MKKKMLIMLALATGISLGGAVLPDTAEAASKIKIDTKHFPDLTFRQYVKCFDKNKDGYLTSKERKAVKSIELENENCSLGPSTRQMLNLKGIEYFPQTKELCIVFYKFKNLNFDKLKNLKMVKLVDCKKADGKKSDEKYDFTKNKKLEELCLRNIGDNVKQISFAKDNKIKRLELIVPKQMETVDLSRLSQMDDLQIHDSEVKTIDLKKCVSLKKIWLYQNKNLTKLNFGTHSKLKKLEASDNHLVSLNVSKFSKLEYLNVCNNYLSKLDVSKNTKLIDFNCSYNLLDTLDIANLKELRDLGCAGLGLKELNLKGNPKLQSLGCSNNCLETLDVSENTKLTTLSCGANPLEELDVSMLADLTFLSCSYARLTNLELSKNTKLETLYYTGNRIPSLDLTGHSEKLFISTALDYMQETQLLPQEGSITEDGIPIDKEHFPDYMLRYEVLADFDTNHDGILSDEESLAKQPLDLKKYDTNFCKVIDCTGMEYLKGITGVDYYEETTLLNNTFEL